MIARSFFVIAAVALSGLVPQARAAGDLVVFPDDFADGVRYAIVTRGNVREEIFASRAALDAVKNGQQPPTGTVITLVDYRDGELFRYVVMEKRTGWGADYGRADMGDLHRDRRAVQHDDLVTPNWKASPGAKNSGT